MESLVSTDWLANELGASDLRVVDATNFLPGSGRDPGKEYDEAHIPGAFFLNLAELSDLNDPRPGMLPEFWSSGIKQAFGTAYESYDSDGAYSAQSPTAPVSRTWFTVADGVLTEAYWPVLDRPQIRDLQFFVTDGRNWFREERRDTVSEVRWIENGVPAFRVTTRDLAGHFTIEKTLFADPDRDAIRIKVGERVYQRGEFTKAEVGTEYAPARHERGARRRANMQGGTRVPGRLESGGK